jgi:hypothetical protein
MAHMFGQYAHRAETSETSANRNTSETHLSDGSVDDTLLTKLVEETFGNLNDMH